MKKTAHAKPVTQANVRIDIVDKQYLDQLAAETGESQPKLLHRALETLRRKIFCDKMNKGYQALRADPEQWEDLQKEYKVFDKTSGDGLESL